MSVTLLTKNIEVDMNMSDVLCKWICDESGGGANHESDK